MTLSDTMDILNIIIKHDLNKIEVSIFQESILLSLSTDEFILNNHNLQYINKVSRQYINKCILNLEQKKVLEKSGTHGKQIQYRFCKGIFNV
jgi:hypothetical protein|tara:strand:+ start:16491 stop:16766 length:276 start_codon:yes stop_codon:yes gene_type:complete